MKESSTAYPNCTEPTNLGESANDGWLVVFRALVVLFLLRLADHGLVEPVVALPIAYP